MNKYLEKIAKSLPYRSRVEVVIQKGDKVLVMKCKNKETGDEWFAFPGGGVDGSSEAKAAENECLEEVGVKVKNLKKTETTYREEGGLSKKDDRHLKYRGSETRWYTADYDSMDRSKLGEDGDSRKYRWRSLQEALQDVKGTKEVATQRVKVLSALKGSNRVLEKIAMTKVALNAFKAREMAKAVGVIPVPKSSWRLALNKLRDGRGNPLQGKELAEGKSNLGMLSNNSKQYIDKILRKHTAGPSKVDLSKVPAAVLDRTRLSMSRGVSSEFSFRKTGKNEVGGFSKGLPGAISMPKSHVTEFGTVHTHPISQSMVERRPFRSRSTITSSPSRTDTEGMKRRALQNKSQTQYHNIYAPNQQTESVSKVRTHGDKVVGSTTVYFDRAPRKTK